MCARMYIWLYVRIRTNTDIQKVKVQEDKKTAKRNAKRGEHMNRKSRREEERENESKPLT